MTLAEKNKNPLNLRPLPNGEKWKGQVGVDRNSVTGAFCVFESNTMGVRAAVVNMRSYIKTGSRTLRDVIYRWAPPPAGGLTGTSGSAVGGVDQNHTEAYLSAVCAEAAVPYNFDMTPLTLSPPSEHWMGKLAGVIRAMNRVEAGKVTISTTEARDGIRMALGVPAGYVRQDDGNVVREDMSKSETLKLNTQGQATNVLATGATAITAVSAIPDWRIALIVAGMIIVSGLGVGFYLLKLRKDRRMMSEKGIA